MAITVTIDGTTHTLTRPQYHVLSYLRNHGSYEGAYAELGVFMDGPSRLIPSNVDRSLEACIRRGWAQQTADGDFEVTDLGQRIIVALEDDQ